MDVVQIIINEFPVAVNLEVNEQVENVTIEVNQAVAGLSAYMDAMVNGGFEGTKEEWFASLKGDKGDKGEQGNQGEPGATGDQGEQGNPFLWQDFTQDQRDELKGDPGDQGEPGESAQFGEGEKITGIDAGILGEESYYEGFMYKCVVEGEASETVWIKWAVINS
ncbi:MAG TPA: hypothetical protein DCR40_10330 [Prolixibacteraceae bacterium]|nr:hypothetical protein [Prolixibacteraceae bacterium]